MNPLQQLSKPKYSFFELTVMCFSLCIGLGIFVISVRLFAILSHQTIGGFVPLALLVGAFPAFFTAFIAGVCSSIWPSCGGDYSYFTRKIGPFPGTIITWGYWFAKPMQIQGAALTGALLITQACKLAGWSATATFLSKYLLIFAGFLMLIGFLINYCGLEGKAHLVTGTITLLVCLFFIGFGFGHNHQEFYSLMNLQDSILETIKATQFPPVTLLGFMMGMAILQFAYGGVTFGQNAGLEVKFPTYKLWKTIAIALLVATGLYFAISFVFFQSVPWQYVYAKALQVKDFTALEAMQIYIPKNVFTLVSFLLPVLLWDNMIMLGFRSSRQGFSTALDGFWGKSTLYSKVSSRFATPVVQIYIVYGVALLIMLLIKMPELGFFANYSYTLGLGVSGLLPFKISTADLERVFPQNTKTIHRVLKLMGVVSLVFYGAILVGLFFSSIVIAGTWVGLLLIGAIMYWVQIKRYPEILEKMKTFQTISLVPALGSRFEDHRREQDKMTSSLKLKT